MPFGYGVSYAKKNCPVQSYIPEFWVDFSVNQLDK